MSDVKRPTQTRREQAAATRGRIVEAALAVFAESGYTGAKMTDIAARANVAVQTVYFTFHTKPELLQACYQHAVLGPSGLPPAQTPAMQEVFRARSGRSALQWFAVGNAEITARAAAIDEVARGASHEPEALEVRRHSEQLRRDGYRRVVDHIAERFGLREGLEPDAATDIMLTLAGGTTYLTLAGYGWSQQQYIDWLVDILASQLLRHPGRAAR